MLQPRWTDGARIATAGQPIDKGKPAISQMIHQIDGHPGFHLPWKPDSAEVAASSDLDGGRALKQIIAESLNGTLQQAVASLALFSPKPFLALRLRVSLP